MKNEPEDAEVAKQKKREYDRQRYLANKDRLLAQCKVYRESSDKEKRKAYAKAYRESEHGREVIRKWRQNNPDKLKAKRKRYREDPAHTEVILRRSRREMGVINPSGERKVGNCETCTDYADPLHLDHDHRTGLMRG